MTLTEAMAAVIAEHSVEYDRNQIVRCNCGWSAKVGGELAQQERVHLAHAIVTDPDVQAALAERLRETNVPDPEYAEDAGCCREHDRRLARLGRRPPRPEGRQ